MSTDFIAEILGEILAKPSGLRAVILPRSANARARAASMARAANRIYQAADGQPYAVVVTSGRQSVVEDEALFIPLDKTIQYRQNDRLYIFTERETALESIEAATSTVLGEDFPANALGSVSIQSISNSVARRVFIELGLSATNRDAGPEELCVENCLQTIFEAHKSSANLASTDWNALWWEHANFGVGNLLKYAAQIRKQNSSLTTSEFFIRFTFACFGLPAPKNGMLLKNKLAGIGRDIDSAFQAWWVDEEAVGSSISMINKRPEVLQTGNSHPIENMLWLGYNEARATLDSNLLGFVDCVTRSPLGIEAFSNFTEDQFFNPPSTNSEPSELRIFDTTGLVDRKIPRVDPALNLNLILPQGASDSPSDILLTEELRVDIPVLDKFSDSHIQGSELTLKTNLKGITWSGSLNKEGEGLVASGRFKIEAGQAPYKHFSKEIKISLELPSNDPLKGLVDEKSTALALIFPHFGPNVLVAEMKSGNKPSKFTYAGALVRGSSDNSFVIEIADGSRDHLIIGYGLQCEINGKTVNEESGFKATFVDLTRVETDVLVEIDGLGFELRPASVEVLPVESPLIAAIDKRQLTSAAPSDGNRESIRGRLEAVFATGINREDFLARNFHIALPSESSMDFDLANLGTHKGLVMPTGMQTLWDSTVDFSLIADFQESEFVKEFQVTFQNLQIESALITRNLSGKSPDWPSRTSWRHLWDEYRPALDAYLYAYEAMVAAARSLNNPATIFWASYPFSSSIWDVEGSGSCKAILISPLHPIRLAWLASVESTIWEADDAESLVGAIEGWNFPALGPSPTQSGAFIAVPADNGDGQLFASWGYLLAASVDGPKSLQPPIQIAGHNAPGSAAGGMNRSSVASALKDYRRVNPHVTTLTVDLAATSKVARLSEIDEAILSVTKEWNSPQYYDLIPGGLRILDSLNREGPAPIGGAQAILEEGLNFPFTWSQYQHQNQQSKKCNVRFLQDSGLRIEVEPKGNASAGSANLGIISSVPLRRFEAHTGKLDDSKRALSFPTLNVSASTNVFNNAMNSLENAGARPSVRSQLFKALLVDENADWTVSGESMVSPGSIASLLRAEDNQKMLWEWRPPFFERGSVSQIEQRPFISIARIPKSFRHQIEVLLTKAMGKPVSPSDVEEVLSRLGSRGVGLASLIAMGGTHAAGALGFYIALSLVDMLNDENVDHFVMPIDACDGLLKSLASQKFKDLSSNRADLLLISITDDSVLLTPLEIKFYGLGKEHPSPMLPNSNDSVLDKAKAQITATRDLLEDIIAEGSRRATSSRGNFMLWLNTLTSLIEASIKLNPSEVSDPSRLRDRLNTLVEGESRLLVGKPLITYFGHEAKAVSGGDFQIEQVVGSPEDRSWGLLSLNSMRGLESSFEIDMETDLVKSWQNLVLWATNRPPASLNAKSAVKVDGQSNSDSDPIDVEADAAIAKIQRGHATNETNEVSDGSGAAAADSPEQTGVQVSESNPEAHHQVGKNDAPEKEGFSQAQIAEPRLWPESEGIRIKIGNRIGAIGDGVVDFWPGNTELSHMNFGVVGNLGTGKTQFLLAAITQIRHSATRTQSNPLSFLIFDYKKDYQRESFLKQVGGVVLRPDQGIPLNVLALKGEYSRIAAVKKAESFCDVISKIYANIGPVQKDTLIDSIVELYESSPDHRPPTLSEVLARYKVASKKDSDAVISVLNKFVRRNLFIEDQDKVQTFEDLIDGKVLVVSLSDFGADNDSKNTLVVLFLDLYFEYMQKATKYDFSGNNPQTRRLNSFLLVDEATNIMQYEFQILKSILLEGREFGFGTILASQYLSHFKTANMNYAETLNTWMIHQVPSVNFKQLRELGIPDATEQVARMISEFKPHEGYYSSLNHRGIHIMGLPFYKLFQ